MATGDKLVTLAGLKAVHDADNISALKSAINTKITEPQTDGTSGQVLTTDGNGGRTWSTVQGGGGTSDYSALTNKPQIGGVTLTGNKSLNDLGIASATDVSGKLDSPSTAGTEGQVLTSDGNGGQTWEDSLSSSDIANAVDVWLGNNITNPDSPPLDRSLTSSSAAAPADLTGKIESILDIVRSSTKNLNVTPYDTTRTTSGITYTAASDNSVTITGTASAASRYFTDQSENIPYRFWLPAGTYTLSGGMGSSLIVSLLLYVNKTDTSFDSEQSASSTKTFTTSQGYWAVVRFVVAKNYVASGEVFKAQLETGSTATTYESPFGADMDSIRLDSIEADIEELKSGDNSAFVANTPMRLNETMNGVILKCESECTCTIKSDTIDDFDHFGTTYYRTTESESSGIITITTTELATHWYDGAFTMHLHSLTVGETYCIVIDTSDIVLDPANYVNGGYYRLYEDDSTESSYTDFSVITSGIRIVKFIATAQTQMLKGFVYDGSHFSANNTYTKFRDIYVNRYSAGVEKTEIVNDSQTFTDELYLGTLAKGMTVSASPACEIYKQGAVISKSRFHGKKMVCFGDSITSLGELRTSFPAVIENVTGMEVINVGFGGCRMSHSTSFTDPFSMQALATAISTNTWTDQDASVGSMTQDTNALIHLTALKSINWNTVDFVTISYGTNDITNAVTIDDENNPLSTSTFCGALRYSLTTLLTAYPHLKVLILSPIYRYFDDDSMDSDEKTFSGHHFTEWVDGLLDVAKEYKIPAVDMYRTLGFNAVNRGYYFPSNDGTHPNDIGRGRIGEKVSARLLSEY